MIQRLLLVPYTFVLLNWAAIRALYCFLRHERLETLWYDASGPDQAAARALGPTR